MVLFIIPKMDAMFKFTIVLFILSCCLTGYRLVGQRLLATGIPQSVLAQAASPRAPTTTPTTITADSATPTVASFFRAPIAVPSTPTPPKPLAVTTLLTAPEVVSNEQSLVYPEVVIYGDELNASWTIEHSEATQTNLWDTSHWFQQFDPQQAINSGAAAIAVSPQADYGTVFFSVRPASGAVYQRQDVLGISLWLNSGNAGITTADLAITVLGSNQVPYWTPGDHSVFPEGTGTFSETRLYFLKINRTIPANTWVNVVVWLDDLQFDPIYQYVTGFYIKNDPAFRSTYYLDQVALLLAP
jgi:hypothetical protein